MYADATLQHCILATDAHLLLWPMKLSGKGNKGMYPNQYEIGIVCAPPPGHKLDKKAPNAPGDWTNHMCCAFDNYSGEWEPAVHATWDTRHQDNSSSTFKEVKRRRVSMHCKQLVPVNISSFGDWTGSRSAT